MLKIGVLVSGSGVILDAIAKAIKKRRIIDAEIMVVISSNPTAHALKVARSHGLGVEVVDPAWFSERREKYDAELMGQLQKHGVEPKRGLVVLADYTRILGPRFVAKYRRRIMNVHPSLLPSFPGLHAQRKALEYGVKVSGCTVLFVDEGIDTGPIILQSAVPILENDSVESLSKKILRKECQTYPEAIRLFAEGKLRIIRRRAKILE